MTELHNGMRNGDAKMKVRLGLGTDISARTLHDQQIDLMYQDENLGSHI